MNKVRSRFIMKKIFKIIMNVRKLKVIKYNKKITASLNITKQDFEIYSELNKFNKKYHTDIANAGTKRLNLSKSNLENGGLDGLIRMKFEELNELDLSYNEISNINM